MNDKYNIVGRVLPRPQHCVRGPARPAPRPRHAGGEGDAPLPLPHGVRETAPWRQHRDRGPGDQRAVRGLKPRRG